MSQGQLAPPSVLRRRLGWGQRTGSLAHEGDRSWGFLKVTQEAVSGPSDGEEAWGKDRGVAGREAGEALRHATGGV